MTVQLDNSIVSVRTLYILKFFKFSTLEDVKNHGKSVIMLKGSSVHGRTITRQVVVEIEELMAS